MASIHKEVSLSGSPAAVWDVVSDVAAVHTRLAPGFVADTVMEGAPTRWCAPSGSATTTPCSRCSPRALEAAWFGSPTCCLMRPAVNVAARMEDGLVAAKWALDAVVSG
jgi:hypothetical protein